MKKGNVKPKKAKRYNEWSQANWNPVKGCTKVDQACTNCYAETMSAWFQRMKRTAGGFAGYGQVIQDGRWNNNVFLDHAVLDQPEKMKKPKRIFVCSMSDLFHEKVPDEFILKVIDVIRKVDRHTYIVLTKRPHRFKLIQHWPENVILSVTVGHQGALGFVDLLRETDAKIKFLSIEPLLGDLAGLNLDGIHWVAVGGESGTDSNRIRPSHPNWVRSIRDKCIASNVAFHFKGWQAWLPNDHVQYAQFKKPFKSADYQQHQWPDGLISYFVGKRGVCESLDGHSWTQPPP